MTKAMFLRFKIHLLALLSVLLIQCKNNETAAPEVVAGKIRFQFEHLIDNSEIKTDTLIYFNLAGNQYLISEIQYFISDVILHKDDGTNILIDEPNDIHYIDTDLLHTHKWEINKEIPVGNYDSLTFTFGICEEKNISNMFVNSPEKDMFWPEFLGGGYHYMKLNGKWLEPDQTIQTTPFNIHLGIGRTFNNLPDSIIEFTHNDFRVSLPNSTFKILNNRVLDFTLTMNIENWFKEPHTYNHNIYGSFIMQNQEAMEKIKENGHNVFSVQINY